MTTANDSEIPPDDNTHNKLDIFFVDKNSKDGNIQAYRTSIPNTLSENTDTNADVNADAGVNAGIHGFLLTATDGKQANSRHELYQNPKIPEIKFRTESSSTLQTVASPLLVQNSVRSKNRRRKKAKRYAELQGAPFGGYKYNVAPKYEIKDATWFKRYQALHNDMMKKAQLSYNRQVARDYASTQQRHQNAAPATLRSLIPKVSYNYGYVYPLYHLHTRDTPMMVNYASNNNAGQYSQALIPPRRLILQNRNIQPQSFFNSQPVAAPQVPPAFQNFRFTPQAVDNSRLMPKAAENPRLVSQAAVPNSRRMPQAAVSNSRLVPQAAATNSRLMPQAAVSNSKLVPQAAVPNSRLVPPAVKNAQLMPKVAENPRLVPQAAVSSSRRMPQAVEKAQLTQAYQPQLVPQDSTLQRIGLKDDASFIDATPNFDRSLWTLNAVQSIIPNEKVRSIIPRVIQTSNTQQQVKAPVLGIATKTSLEKNPVKLNSISSQSRPGAVMQQQIAKGNSGVSSRIKALQQFRVPLERYTGAIQPGAAANTIKTQAFQNVRQGTRNLPNSQLSAAAVKISPAVPVKDTQFNSFDPVKKPQSVLKASRNNRKVAYNDISPGTEIDSDGVTAENLATIFNELDSDTNAAILDQAVSKKNDIVKPFTDVSRMQDQIEMTVLDESAGKKQGTGQQVSFVNVGAEKQNEINLEQKLDTGSAMASPDHASGMTGDMEIKRMFDLRTLHFGLANGNTFD